MVRVALVVPCYNEQEVLPGTCRRLLDALTEFVGSGLASSDSAVYFVDDGSSDRTWELVIELAEGDPRVHGIKLSRNRGQQTALLAGLEHAEGDAVVTMDADLQDDVRVVEQMLRTKRALASSSTKSSDGLAPRDARLR